MNVCSECQYPHTDSDCDNPACYANPNVSARTKDQWRLDQANRAKQERERQFLARMRAHSFSAKSSKQS